MLSELLWTSQKLLCSQVPDAKFLIVYLVWDKKVKFQYIFLEHHCA